MSKELEKVFPLVIRAFKDYEPIPENADIMEKMNDVVAYLNKVGRLTNDVVYDWNNVMQWSMGEGLKEATSEKVDKLILENKVPELINPFVEKITDIAQEQIDLIENNQVATKNEMNVVNEQLAQRVNDLNSRRLNILYPPIPFVGAKGDGVTDDYPAIKAIIDYAIANNYNIKIPNPSVKYILSSSLIFENDINIDIEGGDKEKCLLHFQSSDGIGLWFKHGVVRLSNLQIKTDLDKEGTFKALTLGDTNNVNVNDSLHWSKVYNIKIQGCNQGIVIGNFFDSSLEDVEVMYLVGSNPIGVNFVSGTNVDSNNLLFNRLHVEHTTAGGILLNFDAGLDAATANFVFNGCHFESHRMDCHLVSINNASNITFISTQFTHTSASGETVEVNKKQSFIFNDALSVKFIACGIGGSFTTVTPTDSAPKLIKLMGASNFISFDDCMVSPPYQPADLQNKHLFNVESGFTGDYPTFDNCMIINKSHKLDRFIQGFSTLGRFNNKFYLGMGSDLGLHVSPNKWNLNSTPDNDSNLTAFSTFMQNGLFKTSGVIGRHSGVILPNTTKVIAYNGRSGHTQSGLYVINVKQPNGNSYSALFTYNNYQGSVTLHFSGSIFSTVKDTASKVNVYHLNGQLNVQNTVAENITYSVVPFFAE